ncbi:hypothetical protein AQUCO_01500474v1 [Aquilegia coerulea]|uniref:Uncharacterized protein n=1 Tax=Aquilegia coerulea TaxID=218851 RepID=A0A2G5DTX2_AQUCA|nr:hypothetical protein AQUCO_01500474v1 [Aquilegia coerulea]
MARSSTVPENSHHVRSISLPSRSHPNVGTIEEELIKLGNWSATTSSSSLKAEMICNGLFSLAELYNCVDDLLCLPLTQQELVHQEHEKVVNDFLDESVRLMDICSSTSDILSSMKEHVQNLQSTLRRRHGDLPLQKEVQAYLSFRKKMKKNASKIITSLTRKNINSAPSPLMLREVQNITTSIFQSLIVFVSAPKTKHTRWSLVTKMMQKGQVACEGQGINEMQTVDAELNAFCHNKYDVGTAQQAQKALKTLEVSIEELENGLECMFRHLIQTRVSILNILTH